MMSASEMAVEMVRLSVWSTLCDAYESDTLSDVLGVHRDVLRARCGRDWSQAREGEAVDALAQAMSRLDLASDDQDTLTHMLQSGKY